MLPTTTTALSPRFGLAVAAAVTGLVLAGGVTLASVLGWVGPRQLTASSAEAPAAPPLSLPASAVSDTSPPQVVLVPVVPAGASTQQAAALSNFAPTDTSASGSAMNARPSRAGESAQYRQVDEHETTKLSRDSEHSAGALNLSAREENDND